MANPQFPNDSIAPVAHGAAVTPNDSSDLSGGATRGVYVGVSGDVKVTFASGSTATYVGLASGLIHPVSVTRVWSTGTTATNIVACY